MFTMMIMIMLAVLLPVGAMMLFLFGRLFFILDALPTTFILDGTALVVVILWIMDMTALLLSVALKFVHNGEFSVHPNDVEK
jgi:hypothetical protein